MKVVALVSGGKDSIYAISKAIQTGHEVVGLVSFVSKREDSYMFHLPNIEWVNLFSSAMDIPLHEYMVSGDKEFEVFEMKAALFSLKHEVEFEGVVSGAIESNYQKERVDRMCDELGVKSIAPLWHINNKDYLRSLVLEGFKIKIVGVFAEGLGKEWLGRDIDNITIEHLLKLHEKYGVSLVGEGGEYESFVVDAPFFKKKIEILDSEVIWNSNSGVLKIKKAKVVKK